MHNHFHTVLHADNYDAVRLGLRTLLKRLLPCAKIKDIKEETSLNAAIQVAQPDLLILECSALQGTCSAFIRQLRCHHPHTRILLFTHQQCGQHLANWVAAGVHAIVLKSDGHEQIETALHELSQGQNYFSPNVVSQISILAAEKLV